MTPYDIVVIACMAVAVYLPKVVPLLVVANRIPQGVQRWLGYIAPAVLAALVAPILVLPTGRTPALVPAQGAYLGVLVVAILTRRMVPSIVCGLAIMVAITLIGR